MEIIEKCENCACTHFNEFRVIKNMWQICENCFTMYRVPYSGGAYTSNLIKVCSLSPAQVRKCHEDAFGKSLEISDKEIMELQASLASQSRVQPGLRETTDKFYAYYSDMTGTEEHYKDIFEGFREKVLEPLDIEIKNKTVLDISGGPGDISKLMHDMGANAYLTEYSQEAVDGMAKRFDLPVGKFDYQNDNVDEVFNVKFDIVIVMYSINFCNDLKKFADGLSRCVKPGGMVFIYETPNLNLGSVIRWQLQEYSYTRLYHPDTIAKNFLLSDFDLIEETCSHEPVSCMENVDPVSRLLYYNDISDAKAGALGSLVKFSHQTTGTRFAFSRRP